MTRLYFRLLFACFWAVALAGLIGGEMPFAYSGAAWFGGEEPKSVLADQCDRLWVAKARNDPALECYLTIRKSRLCNAKERAHLVWFIGRYEREKSILEARLRGYLAGIRWNVLRSNEDENLESFHSVSEAEAQKMREEGFAEALRIRTLADLDLTSLARSLVEDGYIAASDFSWHAPYWVDDAFALQPTVRHKCQPA